MVCATDQPKQISFDKLMKYLHDTPFRYSIQMDRNRAEDGIDLRYRFAITQGYEDHVEEIIDILDGPCSVFEMMIALALRCEESIMDDPDIGDRTGQWFWGMIVNMGLGSMYDVRFDEHVVRGIVDRFLDRDYEPNGSGGLFTIYDSDFDMRDMEIWHQLCYYLDSIT